MMEKKSTEHPTAFELSKLAIELDNSSKDEDSSPDTYLEPALELYIKAQELVEEYIANPNFITEKKLREMAEQEDEKNPRGESVKKLKTDNVGIPISDAAHKLGYKGKQAKRNFLKLIEKYEKAEMVSDLKEWFETFGVDEHWMNKLTEFRANLEKAARAKGGHVKAEKQKSAGSKKQG